MEPTIFNGRSVLVSSIPFLFGKLKEGDIVVFEKNKKLIIKRIKEIKNNKVKVSGDNKLDSKKFGWIKRSDIKGKIIAKI